jgi:transketolase
VEYAGVDEPAPADPDAQRRQAEANFQVAMSALRKHPEVVDAISDRLLDLAARVPEDVPTFNLGGRGADVFSDERLFDFEAYPAEMYRKPGEQAPNRAALGAWGSWVNTIAKRDYGRPLFAAASADLAESTNLAGFGKGWGGAEGWGWYNRSSNARGALLPTEITEFTNAGMITGMASVNLADDPFGAFDGFWGAISTYGSFVYLNYGPLRLFSQLAQDCDLKVGKVLWVAGHSGPETADDSRTHFGIFETQVTQLFPDGHVIDLHPWEYNEVPVVLGAALRQKAPIVALHLTRPPIEIPDREQLGMPSHFAAARGAYVLHEVPAGTTSMGTVFVQGTASTANLVKVLPELDRAGIHVKVVAAISPQLFRLQPSAYREAVITPADRLGAMAVTNRNWRSMREWTDGPALEEYSLSSDRDDRWRTGGTLDEVLDEAGLMPSQILEGIERFARDRERRHQVLERAVEATAGGRP